MDQKEDPSQATQNQSNTNKEAEGKGSNMQKAFLDKLDYLLAHAKETICGGLMFFGLIVSFFHGFGCLMVGCGFGWYFSSEIMVVTDIAKSYYPKNGLFKTLMWSGLLFLTFAKMPMLSLSLLIMCVAGALTAKERQK